MAISLIEPDNGGHIREVLGEHLATHRALHTPADRPAEWLPNNGAVQRIGKILDKAKTAVETELHLNTESAHPRHGRPTFAAIMEKYIFAIAKELDEYCIGANVAFINVWKVSLEDQELSDLIQIQIESDRVIIRLPFMFLQYGGNQDPIAKLLAEKIAECSDFPQWSHWHASFIHSHSLSNRQRARDVDNYCYWKIIDVIALAMNTSDSATRFDMNSTSYFSDDHPTGCFVVIRPKSSDFYELDPDELRGLDIFEQAQGV